MGSADWRNVGGSLGSIMWIDGDGGAASCNVDSLGVLSDGIRVVQAGEGESESEKPFESVLHCARAALTRKHGLEVKTDKNTNLGQKMKERRWEVDLFL